MVLLGHDMLLFFYGAVRLEQLPEGLEVEE